MTSTETTTTESTASGLFDFGFVNDPRQVKFDTITDRWMIACRDGTILQVWGAYVYAI